MNKLKKLPDTEFEVMKAVWKHQPPVTTNMLMEALGNAKGWKAPTLITFLNRLMKKGFLRSEKNGKERTYFPLIEREEYLKFETENFVKIYHGNSFLNFANSFYDGKKLTKEELQELIKMMEKEE